MIVTHEMSLRSKGADQVVFTDRGRIVEAAPPPGFSPLSGRPAQAVSGKDADGQMNSGCRLHPAGFAASAGIETRCLIPGEFSSNDKAGRRFNPRPFTTPFCAHFSPDRAIPWMKYRWKNR